MREERQGELEAGIEEEVEEVSPADCTQSSHVGVIHILQWRKLNKKKLCALVKTTETFRTDFWKGDFLKRRSFISMKLSQNGQGKSFEETFY